MAKSAGKDLGERIARARVFRGQAQAEFAKKAGIGRERLASYETGRVPLPWSVGLQICAAHNINPGWLAEGLGPMRPFWRPSANDVAERALFLETYATIPGRYTVQAALAVVTVAQYGTALRSALEHGDERVQSLALNDALETIHLLFDTLPASQKKRLGDELLKLAEKYVAAVLDEHTPKTG